MSLSKKNYVAVAAILTELRNEVAGQNSEWAIGWQDALDAVSEELSSYFEGDNPNFDMDRFLTAAGY